jgi:glycosyl transferase family 87
MPTILSLYPVLDRWLNTAGVVLLVIVSAVIMSKPITLSLPAGGDLPPGGDFGAFYGAGAIANAGDYSVLYDVETQRQIQQPLTVSDEGLFWYFSYPPIVATVFGLFAALSFKTAAILYAALMLGCWLTAAWLARPLLPRVLGGRWPLAAGLSLLFWPAFQAISGGNNTAFTVLVLVSVWRLLEAERDIAAGVVGSLLLFKPTFGVPLLLLWILARRRRVIGGALAGAAVFWAINSLVAGTSWVSVWVQQGVEFGKADAVVNGVSASSALGFAQNVSSGTRSGLVVAAIAVAGAMWLWVVWLWRNESDVGALMAVTSVVFILGSPHAMAHEVAVLLLAVAVIVERSPRPVSHLSTGTGLLIVASWSIEFQREIGWSPGFVIAAVIGLITVVEALRWFRTDEEVEHRMGISA